MMNKPPKFDKLIDSSLPFGEQLDIAFKMYQKIADSPDIGKEEKIQACGDAMLYILEMMQHNTDKKETDIENRTDAG